jgi:hypothetical protein
MHEVLLSQLTLYKIGASRVKSEPGHNELMKNQMDEGEETMGYFSNHADPEQRRRAGHDDQTERDAKARPLGARDVQRVGGVRHYY